MDKFEYIYPLHKLLSSSDIPVAISEIGRILNCSKDSSENIIKDMRLYLNAPIKFDKDTKGYYYDRDESSGYELPGLWFNSSELYGLFASYQLLSEVGPGLLESQILPIKNKIESLMQTNSMHKGELAKRVRILKMAARSPSAKHFSVVASALLMRKQLKIKYAGRDRNTITERILSPQRLVHYRDNWYIDTWCHLREQLRTFSIDRIEYSMLINNKALEIEEVVLNEHFTTAYGIFSGKPNKKAVLKFSKEVSQWVSKEQWHRDQNGQFDLNGCYELEIPYRDPRELIQDILRFGPDVEVLKPEKLREEIKGKLSGAYELYSQEKKS